MDGALTALALAGVIAVGLFISYQGALIGHPSAYWIWHDILGVLP